MVCQIRVSTATINQENWFISGNSISSEKFMTISGKSIIDLEYSLAYVLVIRLIRFIKYVGSWNQTIVTLFVQKIRKFHLKYQEKSDIYMEKSDKYNENPKGNFSKHPVNLQYLPITESSRDSCNVPILTSATERAAAFLVDDAISATTLFRGCAKKFAFITFTSENGYLSSSFRQQCI